VEEEDAQRKAKEKEPEFLYPQAKLDHKRSNTATMQSKANQDLAS
jgi:hypothetical protein